MPTVQFRGETVECETGAVLRDVLREAGLSPHNGLAGAANCRGHGTCGTCAVRVDGDVDGSTERERVRLGLPPLSGVDAEDLRLACRTTVRGDVTVRKGEGFWGQDWSGTE